MDQTDIKFIDKSRPDEQIRGYDRSIIEQGFIIFVWGNGGENVGYNLALIDFFVQQTVEE